MYSKVILQRLNPEPIVLPCSRWRIDYDLNIILGGLEPQIWALKICR